MDQTNILKSIQGEELLLLLLFIMGNISNVLCRLRGTLVLDNPLKTQINLISESGIN